MRKACSFAIPALAILFLAACTSPKKIVYFQDISAAKIDSLTKPTAHIIQTNDILQITVTSLNPEADAPFNKNSPSIENSNGYPAGYTVDSSGSIDLPYLGTTGVAGLTSYRLKTMLRERLSPFLKEPAINVRIANYKISVLGEVAKPGTYTIPVERVTLPEALSLAGDLTINGQRDNVLIIREENGHRTYARIDLKKSDVFQSPFYYLHANDVIYIEPGRGKIAQADTRRWQVISLITTLVSLGTIIISRID